jgi:hypothetical protein
MLLMPTLLNCGRSTHLLFIPVLIIFVLLITLGGQAGRRAAKPDA